MSKPAKISVFDKTPALPQKPMQNCKNCKNDITHPKHAPLRLAEPEKLQILPKKHPPRKNTPHLCKETIRKLDNNAGQT